MRIFFFVMLGLLSSYSHAADTVIGKWKGRIIENKLPIVVSISVDSLALGLKSLTVQYANPRNCSARGEYAGPIDGEEIFYLQDATLNSHCIGFTYSTSSVIKLKLNSAGELNYEIHDVKKHKKRLEGGTLMREQ